MPIVRIAAEQAVANRKSNPFAGWGERGAENRVEPIARPSFSVPFRIPPKSKIFTVGSCFARNVEDELLRQGFDLPMRKVEVEDSAVLNNYGAPSIYNEFAWAFGEEKYDPQAHIVEVMPGKFADIHLPPNRRPQPYEEVLARRLAISDAYRQAAECSVIIMTLGLVELWFDTKTGYYLNVGPRPSQIRAEPARFEMHVLSYEECHGFLDRALAIIRRRCRADVRVLLTVSPVPLTQTHRDEDVIVANMYSKSLLRVVAESMVTRHGFVTYYPSYESVMYSDRQRVWKDDMVHVRDEIVALNVGRMIDAYVQPEKNLDTYRAEIESGGMATAVESARKLREEGGLLASRFFDEFAHLSRADAEFALEHALHFERLANYQGMLDVLHAAPEGIAAVKMIPLKATALGQLGRAAEGMALFDAFLEQGTDQTEKIKSWVFWQSLLETAITTEEEGVALSALHRVAQAHVNYRPWAYRRVGTWYLKRGKLDQAVNFLEMSARIDDRGMVSVLLLAEAYASLGKRAEAIESLDRLTGTELAATPRAERLRRLLA